MSAAQWNAYDKAEPQVASDKRAANPSLNFADLVADSSSFSNLGQTASNANAFLPNISITGFDNGGRWQTAEAAPGASAHAFFGSSCGEASKNAASPYQSLEQGIANEFSAINNQLGQIDNQMSMITKETEALEAGAFGSNASGGALVPGSDAQGSVAPAGSDTGTGSATPAAQADSTSASGSPTPATQADSTSAPGSPAPATQADSTSAPGSPTAAAQAGSTSPSGSTSSSAQAGSDSVPSGSQTASTTSATPFTLSPEVQQLVSQLGLTPIVSGPVVDNVTGYGGHGATAEPLSDYGTPDGNGGFTITNDPSTWGGDLTPTTQATGTQLFVADVKFNPNSVGTADFDGGTMTSWPAVWAGSGQNSGSSLEQEIDTLEYFGSNNDPNAASTLRDWNTNTGIPTDSSTPIDTSLFANAATTGVEVASLINDQTNSITNYINGQQVSSFNINSTDPAETTPISWLLGTGNGEPFDVTNMALFTPATQS